MKNFSLFIFLLLQLHLFAQDSTVVVVRLVDKSTGDAVPNANISFTTNGLKLKVVTSNHRGEGVMKVRKTISLRVGASHPTYESVAKDVATATGKDTVFVTVPMLSMRLNYISDVIIKPEGVPYTVFGSNRLSVADFEIQKDGTMILLAYPKRLTKGSEVLIYDGKDVQNSFEVPGIAKELKRDFRGSAHLVCENNVFGINVKSNGVIELATIPADYFAKYVMPIVDTNDSKVYFSNFSEIYPAFDYYSFDKIDSAYGKIVSIEDEFMMELYRSEYKWVDVRTKMWAHQKQFETGIDAEVWVGANYFTRSLYYKELYAPMFHRNDTLFVFDYYKDQLLKFNVEGELIESIGIYHHYQPKVSGWKRDVFQDLATGKIYARFEKAGWTFIGLIDTNTGEVTERVQLEYQWVDKVMIHNGFVYYVYRPLESIQKRFLYKEKLPTKSQTTTSEEFSE